jgi:GMP synthase-like glutamine amidotransferase
MILIVDMNWKKSSLGYYEFVLPVVSLVEKMDNYLVKHFSEIKQQDTEHADKIILSGTALKDNFASAHPEKFGWIKDVEKPVLGICAGMETIGVTHGLPLVSCIEIGMTEITTLKENQLFSGTFKAYSLHNFAVKSANQFEILARSNDCVQAVKHASKSIYGVLFHPEVRNAEILNRFLKLKR